MRQRRSSFFRKLSAVVVGGVVLSVCFIAPSQPVFAANNTHAWFPCSWSTKLWSGAVRVGYVSPPADSWSKDTPSSPSVKNSFFDRAKDATVRWNPYLSAASSSGYGLQWVGTISSSNTAQVAFRAPSPTVSYMGGYANLPSYCFSGGMNPSYRTQLSGSVYIDIFQYSLWFSQDDSRRAFWESCNPQGVPASTHYTCSKQWDVGSVMTHELGHVLGVRHPENSSGYNRVSAANCLSSVDQATMCSGDWHGAYYRTMQRTPHAWDSASLHHVY